MASAAFGKAAGTSVCFWPEIAPPRPYGGSRFERSPAAGPHALEKSLMIHVTDALLSAMVQAIVAEARGRMRGYLKELGVDV